MLTLSSGPAAVIRGFLQRSISEDVTLLDDEDIFERGLVTSRFALQLVLFLEDAFNVAVETEDLELANFSSIEAMCRFLARKQDAAAAA